MEPANSPIFRLRRDGRILGPFPRTRVRLMARRGEVLSTDEVSLNGGPWLPVASTSLIGDMPRKPAVTLKGSSSASPASPAGDTVVALEVPWPTKPAIKPATKPAMAKPEAKPPAKPAAKPGVRPTTPPAPPASKQAPAAPAAEPLAEWAQSAPRYTSRHVRRKPRKGGGLSLEAVVLGLLALLALAAIVGAAFWLGRRASPPVPVAVAPAVAPAAPAAALAEPAEGQAFAGRTYGLRETPEGAVVMRLRLLAGGTIETIDMGNVSVSRQVSQWKVAGGELFLANASGVALYRFPARAEWRKLDGTFGGKKWRQLTLEGR